MKQQDSILRTGFAVFSLLISFLFVYYAVSVLMGANTNYGLKIFAYVAGGYGLLNTYILSWAWRSQPGWAPMANLAISACFYGVLVMDTLRDGLQGGKQLAALIGLAVVLGINWFTIKKLCQEKRD